MCHSEVPAGAAQVAAVRTQEVTIGRGPGERLPALLALPEATPAPGILVVNDVFGRSPFYERLAHSLAGEGYVALAPEYFFREGPLAEPTREAATARRERLDERRALDDLDAAAEWLRARDEVAGERIGVVGFCMGGTFVFDLAARRDDLAAVAYYGFPVNRRPSATSAPQPVDVAARMRGPILAHFAAEDAGVTLEDVETLRTKLREAEVDHVFHVYPGVGHGFLKASLDEPGSPGHDAAMLSWRRTLEFFRAHLSA
jgi:dienelactone hydrolase